MEQRTIRHRHRQVQRPTTIGNKYDSNRMNLPFTIETYFVTRKEGVSLSGDNHVLVSIESHPDAPPRSRSRQRGERRRDSCLRLLTAEPASHPRTFHDHLVRC